MRCIRLSPRLVFLSFLLLSVFLTAERVGAAPTRPNIIFILADDLGYTDLSCYGQRNFSTLHIDELAAEGLRFTQHYAGSTVCGPSRACLLTGQHTGHVYQRGNGKLRLRPDPENLTVARLLQQAGYHTAMIGKSGVSSNDDDPAFPNEKGFEHFFGYVSHAAAHRYYPKQLAQNGEWIHYPGNHGKQGDTYSGDLFRRDALQYLEDHKEGPFFLHLSLQQPHADLNVPDEWKEPFLKTYANDPPYKGGHYRAEKRPKATYAGMVIYLDDTVGQVVAKLRELGIEKNTLVIFSSDNGPMSEGGWDKNYFNSAGPLRGGKRDLYEGGVRVPTIAWWPGVIEPGRTTDHVSAHWDFLPTACELAGTPPFHEGGASDIDGVSYAPTLLGRGDQPRHGYLYWEFYEEGGKQAVRLGDWKGVRLQVSKNPDSSIELYDLTSDLGETTDVASQHPDVVSKIESIMREAHTPTDRYSLRPWVHGN